jgi:hypothetical protein
MKIVKTDMASGVPAFNLSLGEFGQKVKFKIQKFKNVVILEVFNC